MVFRGEDRLDDVEIGDEIQHYFISSLNGTISNSSDISLVDSGAFRYMTTQDWHKGKGRRRNFKKKRNTSEESNPIQTRKKINLFKIKCFSCNNFGHCDFQCPQKKIKRKKL